MNKTVGLLTLGACAALVLLDASGEIVSGRGANVVRTIAATKHVNEYTHSLSYRGRPSFEARRFAPSTSG